MGLQQTSCILEKIDKEIGSNQNFLKKCEELQKLVGATDNKLAAIFEKYKKVGDQNEIDECI